MPESQDKGPKAENNILEQYEKLKENFTQLEKEEQQMKSYLNVNVFDYVQNKQNIENIFSINNSKLSFLEYDPNTYKFNPNIPIIEINNLTKTYASRKLPSLLNLSLRVYLGDVHLIIGPSGSGKTTLFNCLKGSEDYEGEILIEGTEISLHPEQKNDQLIGFISKEVPWDAYATVEHVISERFQELNRTEIEMQNYIRSALENFNLTHIRHFYTIDLSLLEKRKVQIIISLINDPHILICDDIFVGLQQHECFELLIILNRIKQGSRSIVIFSNAFGDLVKFSDSLTILSGGKSYYSGPTQDFLFSRILNYSISVKEPDKAIHILKNINGCNSFTYKKEINLILANFDGQLSLLQFQQECANQGIIIQELRLLETILENLFPLLKHSGNKEALKDINTQRFFAP